jgi:hypothetical protein
MKRTSRKNAEALQVRETLLYQVKRPSSIAEPRMAGATRIGELQVARFAGRSS